jgi:hypothetical protein
MSRSPAPLFAVLVLAAAACGRKPAFLGGPACPHDLDGGRIADSTVLVSSIATVVRHDLSVDQVSHLPGTEKLGPGGRLQGLTIVRHQLSYKTAIAVTSSLFGAPRCAWIDKLTVDITPDKIEIFVPSDYPEGSCEYEQILAHEMEHEETHRDVLAQTAEDMRRALAKADYLPTRATPLAVADRSEAERRIEAMVDKAAKPVYAGFKETLRERQAVIDLPENYRWTASRCSHWK